jgi:hypothetical protein
MPRKIEVLNLSTGDTRTYYNVSPMTAVALAYMDHNPIPIDAVLGERSVAMGDFYAMME